MALNFVKFKVLNAEFCMHEEFGNFLRKEKKIKVGIETKDELTVIYKVIILLNSCFDNY